MKLTAGYKLVLPPKKKKRKPPRIKNAYQVPGTNFLNNSCLGTKQSQGPF